MSNHYDTSNHDELAMVNVGLEIFFNVYEKGYQLTDSQLRVLLGIPAKIDLKDLRKHSLDAKKQVLASKIINRLSYLVSIWAFVETLEPEETWYEYLNRPNTLFNGMSALDVMLKGKTTDLQKICDYLTSLT